MGGERLHQSNILNKKYLHTHSHNNIDNTDKKEEFFPIYRKNYSLKIVNTLATLCHIYLNLKAT